MNFEVIIILALSIHPEYVSDILSGKKKTEYRTWKTKYRGDLLVCSTRKKTAGFISGYALCVVSLDAIKPLTRTTFGWEFSALRLIFPVKVKGKQRLFKVDNSLIHFVSDSDYSINNEGIPIPTPEFFNDYYAPLIE